MSNTKRKFNRFNFSVDVECWANDDLFSGMTKDVSRNGMSLVSQSCSVEVGSLLQFQMQHPRSEATIEANGEIAWKRRKGNEWHLGLRFKDINKVNKAEILDAAYDSWINFIRKPTTIRSAQT